MKTLAYIGLLLFIFFTYIENMTAKKTLEIGDKAPSFNLLKEHKGKAVVLYFYPKDMTPGCTQESCDFRDEYSAIKRAGAVVIGVSKDSEASHEKFKDKHSLPFPLIADIEGKLCEAYGVWQQKMLYGRKFMGIVRSTFIIGPDGKIAKIYPKVKVKGHVEEILEDLKGLK